LKLFNGYFCLFIDFRGDIIDIFLVV